MVLSMLAFSAGSASKRHPAKTPALPPKVSHILTSFPQKRGTFVPPRVCDFAHNLGSPHKKLVARMVSRVQANMVEQGDWV
jgi:hypothetical protein